MSVIRLVSSLFQEATDDSPAAAMPVYIDGRLHTADLSDNENTELNVETLQGSICCNKVSIGCRQRHGTFAKLRVARLGSQLV